MNNFLCFLWQWCCRLWLVQSNKKLC